MTLHINPIVQNRDALGTQTGPLFVARRAAHWQTEPPAGPQHAVPRQGRSGVTPEGWMQPLEASWVNTQSRQNSQP
ncbi:hypothetical protein CFBP3846_01168 [Pseudomonas syringae pv. avii]|uniref:Uncharacterized protein n=1 Tax=Pseudomonas syringae pv. avii TaxID=663959 RepID=A0ABY1U2I0_PSESX|nr:hypothetical protein CFBP3846_01168 [Pseudomonas syringae pv. avii]